MLLHTQLAAARQTAMKPAEHPQRSKASALSTAAMLHHAAFDPLRGFPVASKGRGLVWAIVPRLGAGERVREAPVELAVLREAATKIKVLWEHFPRALPKLVGDRERWRRASVATLACLRDAVEGHAGLPALPPSVEAREVAGLSPAFASALAWTFAFDPSGLRAALRHRRELGTAIEHVEPFLAGPDDVARLVHWLELLAAQPARLAGAVLELWRTPGAWTTPTELGPDERTVLQQLDGDVRAQEARLRLARGQAGTRPARRAARGEATAAEAREMRAEPLSLARAVFDQLPVLARARDAERRRALEALVLAATPTVVREWRVWRERFLAACSLDPGAAWRRALKRARQGAPQPVDRARFDELLPRLLASDEQVLAAATRVLGRLPEVRDRSLLRWTLLHSWAQELATGRVPAKGLLAWLRELDAFVRGTTPDAAALLPWRFAVRTNREDFDGYAMPVVWWHAEVSGPAQKQPERFFRAWARACRRPDWMPRSRGESAHDPVTRLMRICASTDDTDQVVELSLALETALRASKQARKSGNSLPREVVRPALAFSGGVPAAFAELALLLAQDKAFEWLAQSDAWFTPPPFDDAQARWLGDLALARDIPAFSRLLRLASSARMLSIDVRAVLSEADAHASAAPHTFDTFPPEVREALLALPGPEAYRTAAADDLRAELFPARERLERELRGLEDQLTAAVEPRRSHLVLRRAALAERLAAPSEVRPSALAAWTKQVGARTRALRASAWIDALRAAVAAGVERKLAAALPAEWWARDELHEVFAHLSDLKPAFRRLAGRVLEARATGPWRGFLDDPRNHAWIERMRRGGLDVDAWLRGPASRTVEHARHGHLTLAVEDDPLEILQMGAWFRTCLSPGDMNFYSTVVIAADANKRLLCLRNARGTALARCLLAVDQELRVRLFQPYAHERDLGFEELAEEAARALGAAVGGGSFGAAPVEVLTAAKWYDDGEYEVQRRVEALLEDTAVRERISAGPDDALVDALAAHLAPRPLDARAAVAGLLNARYSLPIRLMGPLLDRIELDAVRGHYELVVLLQIALAAQRHALGRGIAERLSPCVGCGDAAARAWLTLEEPSRALRILRAARARRRGADPGSVQSDIAFLEAVAYDQLGRHHRALELYRRVLAHPHEAEEDIAQATERVAVLSAYLDR